MSQPSENNQNNESIQNTEANQNTESNQNTEPNQNTDSNQNSESDKNNESTQNNESNKDNEYNKDKKIHENDIWFRDPSVFLNKETLLDIWPQQNMSREEKINAISRFVIYVSFISFIFFNNLQILITGIISLFVLIFTYKYLEKNYRDSNIKEAFSDLSMYKQFRNNLTTPKNNNPIMNVMLPEYQDNPNRLKAVPSYNKAVVEEINDCTKKIVRNNFNDQTIDNKLFNSLGDNLQFEQSMRQFYTTANTVIPNNQKEFAQFCYGNMASCKDGDTEMCLKSTYNHINI